MSAYYETITVPADQIQLVFGQFDRNIKNLEKAYHVAVVLRDDKLRITGSEGSVKRAVSVIEQLVALADKGEEIIVKNWRGRSRIDACSRFEYYLSYNKWKAG